MKIISQLSVLSQDIEDVTTSDLNQEMIDRIAKNAGDFEEFVNAYKANLYSLLQEAYSEDDSSITVTGIDDGKGIQL